MRVHVRPAHPEASIPDPERGRDLVPEGLEVEWSAHWANLARRGDVIVGEAPEAEVESAPSLSPPAGEGEDAPAAEGPKNSRK